MTLVVPFLKALGAETHARGDATRPAAVRHEIGRPHQPARRRIVVSADCIEEVVRCAAGGHEPLEPVDGVPVLDAHGRVE